MTAAEIIARMKRERGSAVIAYRLTPMNTHPEHLRSALETAERAGRLNVGDDAVSWRDETGGVWLLSGGGEAIR